MQLRTKWLTVSSLSVLLMATSMMAGCGRKQEESAATTPEPAIAPAPTEQTMNYITTFQFARPERIGLEYYAKMSDQRDSVAASKKKEIIDSAEIDAFMKLTSTLADKGEMMVKMGDVAILNVVLFYPNEKLYFTLYQNRVKTPDTSFYANTPENEKALSVFLFSLLDK